MEFQNYQCSRVDNLENGPYLVEKIHVIIYITENGCRLIEQCNVSLSTN